MSVANLYWEDEGVSEELLIVLGENVYNDIDAFTESHLYIFYTVQFMWKMIK